jgi:murein DD-endopeptidase MepM/ murein hydrolase activator NlpD
MAERTRPHPQLQEPTQWRGRAVAALRGALGAAATFVKGRAGKARAALADALPDREFHVRSRGAVRYFAISRRAQIGLGVIAAALLAWSVFATFYFVSFDRVMREKNLELAQSRTGQREVLQDIARFNARLGAITENLERNRIELLRLAGREAAFGDTAGLTPEQRQRLAESQQAFKSQIRVLALSWRELNVRTAALERGLRAVGAEVESVLLQQAQIRAERNVLEAEVRRLETDIAEVRAQRDRFEAALRGAMDSGEAVAKTAAERALAAVRGRLQRYEAAVKSAENRAAAAEERAAGADERLAAAEAERLAMKRERDALALRNETLETELAAMRVSQDRLVANLGDRTKKNVEAIERVIASVGLDPERLMALHGKGGRGGPAAAPRPAADPEDAVAVKIALMHNQVERHQILLGIVERLPLATPLDQFRLTSTFGGRRDPFTGAWTQHNGLDFQNAIGTPVLATAPGKVAFAGWRGGYGWMIEIDHGGGVRTRYAHLQSVNVDEGQTVALRHKIGHLGNSGRSSGAHLHYEVVVDGKPVDPQLFLNAGRHVHKR